MKIVAVLETMWGDPGGRAPRYFRINPENNSGKRLYKLVGKSADLIVTNACPERVASAGKHGTPDPVYLRQNLEELERMGWADLILLAGKVAQKTYELSGFKPHSAVVISMPHPAARRWTADTFSEIKNRIDKA